MKKKSLTPWIILIVVPFALLVFTSMAQMIVRIALSGASGDNNAFVAIVNIVSLLIGVLAVIGILALPIWIVMLVITSNNNKKLDTQKK